MIMPENSQIFPRNRGRIWFDLVMALAFTQCAPLLRAHSPDTSYLHCKVAPNELDLRFTFDPATLFRIARPDTDGDGRITRAEMDAVAPDIFDYIESAVELEINGRPVKLGGRSGPAWPPEAGDAIAEKDYRTQLLHFTFRRLSKPVIEDFYICHNLFEELGDRHRIIQDIEQAGKHHEVIYTMFEPDYLYDTFWKPGKKELFRGMVAAVWGSPWLLVVLAPPLMTAFFRQSNVRPMLTSIPGVALLLWHWRSGMEIGTWLLPASGVVASALIGIVGILPLMLCAKATKRIED